MSVEKFSDWFVQQPQLIQELVLFGPPFLVSVIITVALGGRVRTLWLSWMHNPTLAASFEATRRERDGETEADWTHSAKDSIDELIARRGRVER